MSTATITSKGQITVPVAVRTEMGIDTGDLIEFVPIGNGRFEIVAANQSIQAVKGLVRKPAKPVSIDDMNAAIARQTGGAR